MFTNFTPTKVCLFNVDSFIHLTHGYWGTLWHSSAFLWKLIICFFTCIYYLFPGCRWEEGSKTFSYWPYWQGFFLSGYIYFVLNHFYMPDSYLSLVSVALVNSPLNWWNCTLPVVLIFLLTQLSLQSSFELCFHLQIWVCGCWSTS
jgi:hypothetical protein